MRDWRPVLVPGATATRCAWCGRPIAGQVAIAWQPQDRAIVGCWRCTLVAAAHSIMGPAGQLRPNPAHLYCRKADRG